jgi:hypothetical protein
MKNKSVGVLVFSTLLILSQAFGPGVLKSFGQNEVTLPASTVVPVRTSEQLSSKQLQQGTSVNSIVVNRDVRVDGVTVIEAGAPVIAQVSKSDEAGRAGTSGEISINLQATTAVDGSSIGLSGTMSRSGEGKVGQSVGIGAILCPLALLMKGGEGTIPPDAETRTLTSGEHTVVIGEN